ncbi:TlpA family protein disulfide reductase [Acidobacteria bacterium AB60]|nr:TlpA family protein disulfide reductase [Acidobacteria bacterium AB60]
MSRLSRMSTILAVLAIGAGSALAADNLDGRYDATLNLKGTIIPFRLDISGQGKSLAGTLYNGDDKQTTTDASIENGVITLNFEHYLTKIVATLKDGKLDGKLSGRFERETYISEEPFAAVPHVDRPAFQGSVPQIGGVWEIEYDSQKGEKAWRFIVKQSGSAVSASILRIDGDTGALVGSFKDGKFVLSHFDGSRPLVAEVTPQADGTLELRLKGAYTPDKPLIAYRSEAARAKGLPQPDDFVKHTTVRDPNEVFSFKFPDVNGKVVSSDDAKFKGKVVLAIVTGTWCPNCHDEAQYLVQLYKKYHDQGLEIVALDFEEPEQQDTLSRAKAFINKYGVPYTYLIAGAPSEMWEKVPQAVNLNTWPATLFIGRDGRVKLIHSGFAAPASGEFNQQLKQEFTSTIENLLAGKGTPQLAEVNDAGKNPLPAGSAKY